MEKDELSRYIDRVYGYSVRHTYSREEADDLSQEILYTVMKQLATLRGKHALNPGFGASRPM